MVRRAPVSLRVMTIPFRLDGSEFVAVNGGPAHCGFDKSISFVVDSPRNGESTITGTRSLTAGGNRLGMVEGPVWVALAGRSVGPAGAQIDQNSKPRAIRARSVKRGRLTAG